MSIWAKAVLLYVSAFNKIDTTNLLYFRTIHKNVATFRLVLFFSLPLSYTVKHFKVWRPQDSGVTFTVENS